MRRKPVRENKRKAAVSSVVQVQAPVKGWTSDTSPVNAEEGTALVLDNWFPEAETIRLRRGYESFATGIGGAVNSLMAYTGGSTSKLFAAGNSAVYDVTSTGAVGAAEFSGLTNTKFQHTMFANASTQYLYIVNGQDAPRHYNGSVWATPAITVATPANFVHVTAHKFFLWFAEVGTSDLWYLPVNSVAGAATKFSLGGLLKRGGYIMAIATWSVDAGSGMDDLFVAWSSEGEVVIYQGDDPSSASTWALVGVYLTGKPIGRRCIFPVGGDLAMLTEDGIQAISSLMSADRAIASGKALTKRIRQAYSDAAKRSRDVFGWQMITHPVRSMAIVNVPGSGSEDTVQFAMNTITGAWCRFKNMDALCWASFDNDLYFGGTDGVVYQADTGGTDKTQAIEAACLPAYMHLSARGRLKHVKMVNTIFTTDVAGVAPSVSIAVDYEMPTEITASTTNPTGFFIWDVSTWDGPDVWFGQTTYLPWSGSGDVGVVVSPYTTFRGDLDSADDDYDFSVIGWTILYEAGGVL